MGKDSSKKTSKKEVSLSEKVKKLYDYEYSIEYISKVLKISLREARKIYLEVSNCEGVVRFRGV